MRKLEGIEACRNCTSRNYVNGKGLVCKLTGNNPTLEGECAHFALDEQLIEVAPLPEEEVAEEIDMEALRKEENMWAGAIAGLLACVAGAAVWALVSVSTGYQIGYMAIGMGFLVGYAMRIFGKGIRPVFGIMGALFALLGCILGDYLSFIGFIAREYEATYFDALVIIPPSDVFSYLFNNILSMTALFYGFALFQGYKLSFRLQINDGGKI